MKTKQLVKKIAAISTGIAMLGATLTGALALDTTLADYPAPFIKNGVFSGLLVVGANAAASDTIGQAVILSNLQYNAVSEVTQKRKMVVGENTEEIELGGKLSDEFDTEIKDNDLDTLQDTTISFRGSDYDVEDVITLGDSLTLQTSLTDEGDIDYETDVVMEVEKENIGYYYLFGDAIDLNNDNVDSQHPLEIKFLGKTLKIVDVDSDTKFTAYVGSEYFLNVGDSVEIEGREVTLENVYTDSKASVTVDGITKGISLNEPETINGIEVVLDDTFYEANMEGRSATIVVGKESKESYRDGDEYVDDWEWVIDGLLSDKATVVNAQGVPTDGIILGVVNDFKLEDDDALETENCIELPNNYVSLCFDALNTEDYKDFVFEIDEDTDVDDDGSDDKTVYISTNEDEGLRLNSEKTEEVWIYTEKDGVDNITKVYYDDDGDIELGLTLNNTDDDISLRYDDTDLDLNINFDGEDLILTLDDLVSTWDSSLDKLEYKTTDIINKDKNLRTEYGIIIRDPDSNSEDNRVELELPSEQVKGIVSISGFGETVTTGEGNETVEEVVVLKGISKINPIPTSVPVLDTEISDITSNNVILVGGPAVNKWVEPVFGLSVADFTPNEAFIRLVDNGDYVALLVAGYEAVDTRNAADAVARGKLAGKEKIDVVIKTESLGSYVVE